MAYRIDTRYLLNSPLGNAWKRIGTQKRSGVVAPLFAIYSAESVGVGEFADLRLLIDWAAKTGNTILQLLPLNETGAVFCPYDAISSFALEPVHISLSRLFGVRSVALADKISQLKERFPLTSPYVDYGIKAEKLRLLWQVYEEEVSSDVEGLDRFRQENRYWIEDYALFKTLKACHEGKPWYEWPQAFREREETALVQFRKEHEGEILFHIWVQWQLSLQLKAAKEYAAANKVFLKGDLPILVSRDSADVWAHPQFFKLGFAAGAPPDMYCAKGQRWGMPTYNWKAICAGRFTYIREKLRYAQNFYDILRIDHVVGLFRIWSIPYEEPLENQGLNGFFDPKDKLTWGPHGREILNSIIAATSMLLCAEDLGVIPQVCTDTLQELAIPGNDVQRWTKDWKKKHDFLKPDEYRVLSVAMLSTHDTTNWPAWWRYEAGTVDEALFIRKSSGRVDYDAVKNKLFNWDLSRYARLRWQDSVDSTAELAAILEKQNEEIADFIDLYVNSYREKEKLWKHLGLKGPMREGSDASIVRGALKISLDSSAIFCINTIIDWLFLADVFKGDPYQYRFNTPGTTSPKNWSMRLPLSLEALLRHRVCSETRKMVEASGRI